MTLTEIIERENYFKADADKMDASNLTTDNINELLEVIDCRLLQPEFLYMDGERSMAAGGKIRKQVLAIRAKLLAMKAPVLL